MAKSGFDADQTSGWMRLALKPAFLNESGDNGELETGATVLAFASHAMGYLNWGGACQKPINRVKLAPSRRIYCLRCYINHSNFTLITSLK